MGDGFTLLLGSDVVTGELHLRDVEEAGCDRFPLFLREKGPTEYQAADGVVCTRIFGL